MAHSGFPQSRPTLVGQVTGLVQKNVTIFKRNKKTVAVNFLYPLYMIGILVFIAFLVQQTNDYSKVFFQPCQLPSMCGVAAGTNISFVCPAESSMQIGCLTWISETNRTLRAMETADVSCPSVNVFSSEQDLELAFERGYVYAGIVVESLASDKIAYTLRLDGGDDNSGACSSSLNCALNTWQEEGTVPSLVLQQSIPDSSLGDPAFPLSWWVSALNSDGVENVFTLSTASIVNEAASIALQGLPRMATNYSMSTASCSAGSTSHLSPSSIQFQQYPVPSASSEGVFDSFAGFATIIPFYVVIAFTYLSRWTCARVKEEQENKHLETMQVMGLTEWANIIAWTITMLPFVLVAGLGASLLLTQLRVLPGANLMLVFLVIGFFILSFVPFAMLVSLVVNETKSAESLGQLLPIAFGALNFVFVTERRPAPLYAAALIPACAMELAMNAVIELVKEGKTFGMSNVTDQSTGISYLGALGMLIFDICWMAALSWLVSSSSSSILLKNIISDDQNPLLEELVDDEDKASFIEPVMPVSGDKVKVCSLVKEFPGSTSSGPVRAVDNLSFELQEGEIYCLLGHNGAGKSTAISIITGLFGPTSGYVEALGLRLDTRAGLNAVRAQMGVCPQHDVLFDELTVEEHLNLYGHIKGLSSDTLEVQMNDTISAVGLQEKRKELSTKLSGGQKRRLSVAIALMGDPKILILDEPTAGLDPTSRRKIWDLLQERKKGRIILLTTHFMDEADILGDRIAIMSGGKLECCGTSLFLKEQFGVGYHLEVVASPNFHESAFMDLVTSFSPEAVLARSSGAERSITLPSSGRARFADMFDGIESAVESLGVAAYGISLTTLEEVFIRVTKDAERRMNSKLGVAVEAAPKLRLSLSDNAVVKQPSEFRRFQILTNTSVRQIVRSPSSLFCVVVIPVIFSIVSLLVYKYVGGDTSVSVPSIVMESSPPALFTGDTFLYSAPASSSQGVPRCLNTFSSAYESTRVSYETIPEYLNLSDASTSSFAALAFDSLDCKDGYFEGQADLYFNGSTPNAVTIDDLVFCSYGTFIVVLLLFYCNSGLLKNVTVAQVMTVLGSKNSTQLSVNFKPFPYRGPAAVPYDGATVTMAYLMGSLFGIFINWPASLVLTEKESGVAHQFKLVGVSALVRWGVLLVMNLVIFSFVAVPFCALVMAIDVKPFSTPIGFVALCAFMLIAIVQTILVSLCFSLAFTTKKACREVLGTITTMPSIILFAILWNVFPSIPMSGNYPGGLAIADPLYPAFAAINFVFCMLLPPLPLMGALTVVNLQSMYGTIELDAAKLWSWASVYNGYQCASCSTPGLYSVLVPALCGSSLAAMALMLDSNGLLRRFKTNGEPTMGDQINEDAAVARERARIEGLGSGAHEERILIDRIRKVFPGTRVKPAAKVAVHGLSLGLRDGEVFGLLGPNGAGKTSLVNMLTGDLEPTAGDAHIGGHSVVTDLRPVLNDTGFCPQFAGLHELNTLEEELCLYCELRGMTTDQSRAIIDQILDILDIREHAKKLTKQLSGGNKRKLSAALTLIGNPRTIYLDEPSTGVDAKARRNLWDLIDANKDGRVTFLITHSMEEADALSSRIGIMVGGSLRALGTPQELKSSHGSGYVLQLRTSEPILTKEALPRLFPGARLLEENYGSQRFALPLDTRLGPAFRLLDEEAAALGIETYALQQVTLEQILLDLIKRYTPEEEKEKAGEEASDAYGPLNGVVVSAESTNV